MFVAQVAAGDAYLTQAEHLDISEPPGGKDSVVGEVGDHLNYDEVRPVGRSFGSNSNDGPIRAPPHCLPYICLFVLSRWQLVVYSESAALPTFLVVFSFDL